jgi:hypothetical protein
MGNTDDIKCHLVHCFKDITIEEIKDALADEKMMQKRLTVIRYLNRAFTKKKAGKTKF